MTDDQKIKKTKQPLDHPIGDVWHWDHAEPESDQVEQLQQTLQECEEKYKRALADYRNLEFRVKEDKVQMAKFANRWLIEDLLEPLDFMDTATQHISDPGLKMVIDKFHQVLNAHGLEEIKIKVGDEFDEQTMEVVDTKPGDDGKVLEIKRKGYQLNGGVIQHARVVVGKQK